MTSVQLWAWYSVIACQLVAISMLLVRRLWHRFPALVTYLGVSLLQSVGVLLMLNFFRPDAANTTAWNSYYLDLYIKTSLLLLAAQGWMTIEAHYSVAVCYPRIGAYAKWILMVAATLSLVPAVVTSPWDIEAIGGLGEFVNRIVIAQRIVWTIYGCTLLLVWWAISNPSISVRPNAVWNLKIVALSFLSQSVILWIALVSFQQMRNQLDAVRLVIQAGCAVAWAALLTKRGEEWTPTAPSTNEEVEEARQRARSYLDLVRQR